LHPTRNFPSFSVLVMGVLSAAACLFTLEALIKSLIVIQIVTWFAAQCVAVVLLRRVRKNIPRPFSMPLYPWPAVIALAGWIFILVESGAVYVASGVAMLLIGIAIYLWRARGRSEWPWSEVTIQTE
jgi:amino acid transporter